MAQRGFSSFTSTVLSRLSQRSQRLWRIIRKVYQYPLRLYRLLIPRAGQISEQNKADSRPSVIFLGILNGDILRGFDWIYLLHKSTSCFSARLHGRRLWILWGWLRYSSWWNTGCQFELLLELQSQGIQTALEGTSTARKIWTVTYQLLRHGREALEAEEGTSSRWQSFILRMWPMGDSGDP
jgi:hypothetical protein